MAKNRTRDTEVKTWKNVNLFFNSFEYQASKDILTAVQRWCIAWQMYTDMMTAGLNELHSTTSDSLGRGT